MQAYGLKTHIWNNNLRSILLLIFFPILLLGLAYAAMLIYFGLTGSMSTGQGLVYAADYMPRAAPVALGISGTWFAVAFLGHQAMIDMSTKAKSVTPSEQPRAYKLLENLCISRGITMPKLKIIHTDVMNAYASGIRDSNYTVTLTTGLMQNLDDEELEAVIAHELSHIANRDVRLLIIAVIFVGIFAFFGESIVRTMFRTNLSRSTHQHRRSGGGQAGALIFFGIAIVAVTYLLAMLVRFSLSRRREFMADAGAVELTKNPDAMIRALQKISGRAELSHVPAEVREMAFENPRTGFAGMFATHPPIEKRIEALVKFGGGHLGTQSQPSSRREFGTKQVATHKNKRGGPWGRPRRRN